TPCSGATTDNLVNDGYTGPSTLAASFRGHARVAQPAQINRVQAFRDANGGRLDALFMSIGGNDFGFGDIFADCIFPFDATPGGCKSKWQPLIPGKIDAVAAGYANVDAAIKSRLGNVPVLHSDYPNPI